MLAHLIVQGIGEFILTHPNIQLRARGKIYSFNEGNSMYFHEPVKQYLESIKYPKGSGAKPCASAQGCLC